MRDFYFENQGTSTFLAYKLQLTETVDTMSLGMLSNNKIPGLAGTFFTQIDDERFIRFNVSAKVPAKDVFSRAVGRKRLLGVFKGISNAILSAQDYMLEQRSLLVDMDYIFVDVSTNETQLICLPIVEHIEQEEVDLFGFFKNLMFSTQFDTNENNDYVAKILNYLNSTPKFSVKEFSDLLDTLDVETKKNKVEAPAAPAFAPKNPAPQAMSQMAPPQTMPSFQPQQAPQQHLNQQMPTQRPTAPVLPPQQTAQPSFAVPHAPAAPHAPAQPAAPAFQANFAVPNAPAINKMPERKAPAAAVPTIKPEEEISLYYLLQHYNKENAAKYKEQQAIKKAQKQAAKAQGKPAAKEKKSKKGKTNTAPVNYAAAGAPGNFPGQAPANPYQVPGAPAFPQNPQGQAPMQPMYPNQNMGATPPMPGMQQPQMYQNPQMGMPQAPAAPSMPQPQAPAVPNFGETTILGGAVSGETTVLGPSKAPVIQQAYLLRLKNKEKITLDKPVFRIGKEKSFVDYFISDNSSVSRSHANIVSRDGKHFVVDTNSTNHTYVDDQIIQSNQEVEIYNGSKIRLANEEFELHK